MVNLDGLINRLRTLKRRRFSLARLFSIVGILAILAGCMTDPVVLRHPQTGKKVQCGPYYTGTSADTLSAPIRERGCIEDYQRQGYERAME